MSQDLKYTYVTGFDRSIRETVEVAGGKLRPYVDLASGDLYREEGVYQRTSGGGLPAKVTNRFGDSPASEIDYSRRRVTRTPYDDGQYIDWVDVKRMATDIQNPKLNAMRNKFKRQEDIIIDQAGLGTAKGGDNGETDVAFGEGLTNNNIIDVTLGAASGVTNAGFTYEKFVKLIETYGKNSVDIEMYSPVIKLGWQQWNDLMQDDKFINNDYTGSRVIDQNTTAGFADFRGCRFCFSNIVPYMNTAGTGFRIADTDVNTATGTWTDTDSTDIRACYSFVKDAILLEINPDIQTEIEKRGDKKFNWYAYMKMDLGSVRMEEEKVIAIPCDQSPEEA